MITLRLRHIILFTFAFLLTACQFEDSTDCPKEENVAASYINLTIAVSNSDSHSRTREGELPTGGENGDGREAGFERENAVTGITLILYKDGSDGRGINTVITESNNPTLDMVRYFPVTKGTEPVSSPIEAYYTTGDQPIGRPNLDFSGTYHAIVIANQMLPNIKEGTSHLSDLRDIYTRIIYSGDPSMDASSCGNFVMTSEKDKTINFSTATKTEDAAGDKHYDLSGQPLVIERMAARIDFWSKNSNGYKTSTDNAAYTIPGYEYNVTSSTDKFVVTGIVPFNLANGHATYGSEYLLKRIRTDISVAATTSYLGSETTTNYVIDPKTIDKVGTETPTLTSSLESVYTLIGDESKLENTTYNPYYHSIESMHELSTACSAIESAENVVVCYPMENCLLPNESKLYNFATGIAIIGYYYKNGSGTGTRYVYLGYLRHQGDAASYEIQPYTTPLATDATMGTTPAMNFGIVRNNIYRVSINSIDKKGSIELKIKVKKWDPFIHDYIYM